MRKMGRGRVGRLSQVGHREVTSERREGAWRKEGKVLAVNLFLNRVDCMNMVRNSNFVAQGGTSEVRCEGVLRKALEVLVANLFLNRVHCLDLVRRSSCSVF